VPEITRLKRIRKGHPALQTHLRVTFHPAFNDNILVFSKATPRDDRMLVAVSFDPHNAQACDIDLPLWQWGLADDAAFEVEDLLTEQRATWQGGRQHVALNPDQPYRIWQIRTPAKPAQ
jgi:starch synthase (maltosyl-transferring)